MRIQQKLHYVRKIVQYAFLLSVGIHIPRYLWHTEKEMFGYIYSTSLKGKRRKINNSGTPLQCEVQWTFVYTLCYNFNICFSRKSNPPIQTIYKTQLGSYKQAGISLVSGTTIKPTEALAIGFAYGALARSSVKIFLPVLMANTTTGAIYELRV